MARRQHGPLTIEEISKGLGACVDNINALVLDAEALLQADRPARALTCLLVAGQEMGKVQFLQAMLTFESDDLDRWKEIWKAFYNHRSKAAGGLLGLLGPTTPSSVVGPIVVALNAGIGGTAEEERNRTLYVDFEDKDRCWSSPLNDRPNIAPQLLWLTHQALTQLLANREIGLHSPKALTIIREVCVSNPIPDVQETADPAIASAAYYQENLARNEIIRQRLTEEGFDLTT